VRKDLLKLFKVLEQPILNILIARGYIKPKCSRFSQALLTQVGKAKINQSDSLVTEEWIASWRELWPREMRSSSKVIRDRLNTFLLGNDVNPDDIVLATEKWLEDNASPYCGKAMYFFSKETKDGHVSRCLEYVEKIKDDDNTIADDTDLMW